MKSIPHYEHTINFPETVFIDNVNGNDIYYRKGFFDNIDIRYSNKQNDYTSWTFKHIELLQHEKPEYINEINLKVFLKKLKQLQTI